MHGAPPRVPVRRRAIWAFLAGLILVLAGTGLVVVVHAKWQPAPAVKPYDPLPSW